MASPVCLRCLRRSFVPIESSSPVKATQHAAFSTSSSLAANPPKKKGAVASAKQGKTLKLARNKRVSTARPPASGERKALRNRVVLSNVNALEVQGLQDLTRDIVAPDQLAAAQGKVLGLGNDTVDALRALEAFKPTQGWSLFRRPASLVRAQTVELAEALQAAQDEKKVERLVLCGERGSGKSVMMLQGMAMAYLKGHVVIHFPEARDVVIAHSSYRPVKAADGSTIYIQPHYTAQLLQSVVKANQVRLSTMRLSKEHKLPVPVQSNISLDRFAELGANDPEMAWPVWQALLSELTAPSQPDQNGLFRPPIFVSVDGVDHIMRNSAYLDVEANPVHAHDLALIKDYTSMLSGKMELPNGGVVLAAVSESDRPSTPTLEHVIQRALVQPRLEKVTSLRDRIRERFSNVDKEAPIQASVLEDLRAEVEDTHIDNFIRQYVTDWQQFRQAILSLDHEGGKSVSDALLICDRLRIEPPTWHPYLAIDQRVADCMQIAKVKKVPGLSKEEAKGIMEYYAQSGMVRNTITDSLVSERWTLAGSGIIGELERGTVRARF